jgi:hypothetical protein
MPRARREWSVLRDEVRLLLRETDATNSYWSNALLLNLANSAIDLRVMQLAAIDEGWVTDEATPLDLVSGTKTVTLPEGAGRVKRVVLVWTEGGHTYEVPLIREENWSTPVVHGVGSSSVAGYRPTYRLVGNLLVLEPAPKFSLTGAIRLDLESAPARLSADNSKLDLRFPDVMETLIIYDTALLALAVEQSQGNLPEDYVNHLRGFQTTYEAAFLEYATDRTEGRVFGRGYALGG